MPIVVEDVNSSGCEDLQMSRARPTAGGQVSGFRIQRCSQYLYIYIYIYTYIYIYEEVIGWRWKEFDSTDLYANAVWRTKTTHLEGGRDWLHYLATRILRAVHISIFHF